jgi:hypothetical protein
MLTFRLVSVYLAVLLVSVPAVCGSPRPEVANATLRDTLEEVRRIYATDIVLGKPLEIEGLKIIPLANKGLQIGSPP